MNGPGLPEEDWESDIGALLGSLPAVDPPAGFIDAALDHRPLYAGRILASLLSLSFLAGLLIVATDATARSTVVPQVDELAERHDVAVRAGVLDALSAEVDYRVDTPLRLPDGFERTRNLAVEEIRQAFYARNDESVSVFVQDGRLQWSQLSPEELTVIGDQRAWVDEGRRIVIVEASDKTVTIMGLSGSEVGDVLGTIPQDEPTPGDRVRSTVNAIASQLGFPDLD